MSSTPQHYNRPLTDDIIDAAEHDRSQNFEQEIRDLTHRNPRLAQRGLLRAHEAGYLDTAAFMAGIAFAERANAQRDAAAELSGQLALDGLDTSNTTPAA